MDSELILALDQGTSSSKALLVDPGGMIVGRGSGRLGQSTPYPGWVEQSADEIWASIQTALQICLDGIDPKRIRAVGMSTQRESLLLWERATGKPVGPMLSWQDQRTAQACRDLVAAGAGAQVRTLSGLPLDPMFSATKAQWLLDTYDPDRGRARNGDLCLGTVDSWLLFRLGAGHVVEIGNAARTQLMNIRTSEWDEQLLDLFHVERDCLPRIVPSTGPFCVADRLEGVPAGIPIAAVLGDSHAALFAHAAWEPGQVKATYGTGSSVMGVTDPVQETPGGRLDQSVALLPGGQLAAGNGAPFAESRSRADSGLCLTVAWQHGASPTLAVEGNIRSSGATLSWLARTVGSTPGALAALAETSPSDGVYLVPAFNGLGAPWWDNQAAAVITGLTLGIGQAQLARAALESIVFQVEDVVRSVSEAVAPVPVLLADGGASANPFLMQLQADISGRTVCQALDADLSPLGSAHLAGLAIGLWDQAALADLPRPRRTFEPGNTSNDREQRRRGWENALARSRMPA